jgi:hypothetical protein
LSPIKPFFINNTRIKVSSSNPLPDALSKSLFYAGTSTKGKPRLSQDINHITIVAGNKPQSAKAYVYIHPEGQALPRSFEFKNPKNQSWQDFTQNLFVAAHKKLASIQRVGKAGKSLGLSADEMLMGKVGSDMRKVDKKMPQLDMDRYLQMAKELKQERDAIESARHRLEKNFNA